MAIIAERIPDSDIMQITHDGKIICTCNFWEAVEIMEKLAEEDRKNDRRKQ